MTTSTPDSSGVEQQASGDAETKDTVAYETHKKLLGEKKRAAEEAETLKKELAEFKKREKEREETELKAKENWKQLLELREKELNEERTKRTSIEEAIMESKKLSAVLESLNGVVDKQYWSLIPTDKVVVDPASGQPDPASLQSVVREFEKNYALVVKPKTGVKGLPNEAALGGSEKLTVSQWKALKTSKEMKEKQHMVDWST